LTNDSGFITNSYHDSTKQDTLVSWTNIKTINNESLLGTGNITIEWGNTKTFYLSSTSDLTNAQAAYDWYDAGNNPIIVYSGKAYVLYRKVLNTSLQFYSDTYTEDNNDYWYTVIKRYEIYLNLSSWTVTSISNTFSTNASFLRTNKSYSPAYTPQYDGSPATKKYVDDAVAWAGGIQNDTTWTTSTIEAEWVWTDTEFNALSSYWNKIYNIIE
jgi:hypothetical protein